MKNYPQTNIHPGAKIHDSVVVEPFATIQEDVEIGEGTWIAPYVTIMNGSRIGKNCKIFPGAIIGGDPQDLKYKGEKTTVEVGDETIIREFVTVNKGTDYAWKTVIGKHCMLMAYAHVAHDCIIGDHVILANNVNLAGHIIIEDHVTIGGVSGVQQFVRIGTQSFITAGSFVRKDVPPYVKAAREPLSYAGINSIGLERRGFSNEQIRRIEDIYRILYVRHSNISKALAEIELEIPASPERESVLSFIQNSKNGIMKGYAQLNDEDF